MSGKWGLLPNYLTLTGSSLIDNFFCDFMHLLINRYPIYTCIFKSFEKLIKFPPQAVQTLDVLFCAKCTDFIAHVCLPSFLDLTDIPNVMLQLVEISPESAR